MSALSEDAHQLARYIRNLEDFELLERGETYQHMGALIADAILQSGMRYDAQVLPRVQAIVRLYPEAHTTSAFRHVLSQHTPEAVVKIIGRKAAWVQALTDFLAAHQIETEEQLREWLADPSNEQALLQVQGVGLKTANYLKLLAGIPDSAAIDTHLRAFLRAAGITPGDDRAAGAIVIQAASLLGVSAAQLDASIWHYQSR